MSTTADRLRDQNVCIPLPLGRLAADELDSLRGSLHVAQAVIAEVQAALDTYDDDVRAGRYCLVESPMELCLSAVAKAVRP